MWRYFVGFLGAAVAVSVIGGLVNPVESLWVDVGMALGFAVVVFWLGDGIFLHGIFPDSGDAERIKLLFAVAPQWRANLLLIGVFWGAVATTVTWVLAHYFESLWVLLFPILVFGVVLWFLFVRIRRFTEGLPARSDATGGE